MAIGNTTFHLVFIFQIWNDPPNGPFPNENHQVSFQQQHAYGLKIFFVRAENFEKMTSLSKVKSLNMQTCCQGRRWKSVMAFKVSLLNVSGGEQSFPAFFTFCIKMLHRIVGNITFLDFYWLHQFKMDHWHWHWERPLFSLLHYLLQEDKRTEVATGLSEKFSKNPDYYSRFD